MTLRRLSESPPAEHAPHRPRHDHRGPACGVRVLDGEATETRLDRASDGTLTARSVERYPTGMVCGSYDSDIPVLGNEKALGGSSSRSTSTAHR